MHVVIWGEWWEKKGGTRETSRQQQQQHGFMSQRYGQPSTTKAAKQTLDNWQDGGGTWSKWPNLREVSLGEVKGAGSRRLRFQHYNAGVIQKGRTNLILPYFNEGKAIENSIQVTIIRLTINFLLPVSQVSKANAMREFLPDAYQRIALHPADRYRHSILLSNGHWLVPQRCLRPETTRHETAAMMQLFGTGRNFGKWGG